MRKAREIIRLRWEQNLSQKDVAVSCNCSQSTVHDCLARARLAGLGWPLPDELDDEKLESLLYPKRPGGKIKPKPDFKDIHLELGRKGVTLELLWQEYRHVHPDGYGYSQFCALYHRWRSELDVSMRQVHVPGEKFFVDFAGQSIEVIDPQTGEATAHPVFVGAMGLSNLIYAEATEGQEMKSWLRAHENAMRYLGGAPWVWVPDNLKVGVKHPCYYEPEINPSYKELADHYDTVVLPARVCKPKDKAKVENAVLQVERWVLAPLRKQRFFSLAEANQAIGERLEWLNNRRLSKLEESRRTLFEKFDRPALKPLPSRPFQMGQWKRNVAVNIDYHVDFEGHLYSVPCSLIGKRIDVRATGFTLECFYKGRRVASHMRSYFRGGTTTVEEHRPKTHRDYAGWTPSRLMQWASTVGPQTAEAVQTIMLNKRHPEEGYRASLGVIRLADRYGKERVEKACDKARAIKSVTYRSIHSILKTGFDQLPLPEPPAPYEPIEHENIRGKDYYN
jgi:transposase